MNRLLILLCLLLIGATAIVFVNNRSDAMLITGAKAVQATASGQMFMVGLRIDNSGAADRLIGVSSTTADMVSIVNPGNDNAAIIIPANGTGILAMDGAHIMLEVSSDVFGQGAFTPLDLLFENAGTVSVRVQNAGLAKIDHGQMGGVTQTPAPTLSLSWQDTPSRDGAMVRLNLSNFRFVRTGDSTHVPTQGHAHVYLNGLKLARLYEETFQIGPLLAGSYKLTVVLNSNDHRPYLRDGQAVAEVLAFEISD